MSKQSVIILSHAIKNPNFPYISYVHKHAIGMMKNGIKVTTIACTSVIPIVGYLFKKKKKSKVIDGINVIYRRRMSISNLFKKSFINFNGIFFYLSIKKTVKNIIDNENVVLIDAHMFNIEGYAAYLLKKKYKVKTTITFHGSDLEEALSTKIGIKRLKKIAQTIDFYICVSDKLTNMLKALGINNVVTIYNGIEKYEIDRSKKDLSFISVGDFIDSKNFELLIDAFLIFSKKHSNYCLKLIGDGPLKENIVLKIKKYHLENKVFLLGTMDNLSVYKNMASSYAFILVSSPEGFGIVYPEAMYCGCVTIGTKKEGIDGFIIDNVNGFLVNHKVDDIVNIMNYVVTHDCNDIIRQGIEKTKELTWEINANQYINLEGC